MKYVISFCLVILLGFTACKEGKKANNETSEPKQEVVYESFGEKIELDNAITSRRVIS